MILEEHPEILEEFICDLKETERLLAKKNRTLPAPPPKRSTDTLSQEESLDYTQKCFELVNDVIHSIEHKLSEKSPEVQALMQKHFDLFQTFSPMSREIYLNSRDCLKPKSTMHKHYAFLHPKLPHFFYKAMGVFAASAFPE